MVFSVMHFFDVDIEVHYNRIPEEPIFAKTSIPAWLVIGDNIPVNRVSGFIPILPTFTQHCLPICIIDGQSRLASEVVYAD